HAVGQIPTIEGKPDRSAKNAAQCHDGKPPGRAQWRALWSVYGWLGHGVILHGGRAKFGERNARFPGVREASLRACPSRRETAIIRPGAGNRWRRCPLMRAGAFSVSRNLHIMTPGRSGLAFAI